LYGEPIIRDRVAKLASKFGRRLNICTIGFAEHGEDFSVLQSMANVTNEYDSIGTFQAPSLSGESLGLAISSITSSLTATKIELFADSVSSKRTVRDVSREARSSLDDTRVSNDWLVYQGHQVRRFKWSSDEDTWVEAGAITTGAIGVAMRRTIFGEGAERMVRKFREVGSNGQFLGPKMVAKESRFIEDLRSDDLIQFHKVFCKTQCKAQGLADAFNDRVSKLPGAGAMAPRIEFLECGVFLVSDARQGNVGILVEKMLDPTKYKKWNSNCGHVEDQTPDRCPVQAPQTAAFRLPGLGVATLPPLGTVGESDEEAETDSDGLEENHTAVQAGEPGPGRLQFNAGDVPQAFSHFTYRQTRRKMMVCDLQGTLRPESDGAPAIFELTDPVIHYRSSTGCTSVFGRTDRGAKGIHDFFKTHRCSELCRALNRVWLASESGGADGGSSESALVPRTAAK
jgi:hypothetical protein